MVCYRLIDPGSEFRFHREWYVRSALGDLLGEDYSLAQKDKPYRWLDLLLKHRDELFGFLKGQWGNLFGAKYDVLLYDLTSTYFESDPPPAGHVEKPLLEQPWIQARESVRVKILQQESEFYVYVEHAND